MNIMLNSQRENEKDVTVFFTLTDGSDVFRWHADIPKGLDAQKHIESQMEKFRAQINMKLYRVAIPRAAGETELASWDKWLAAGGALEGKPVEKGVWEDTHDGGAEFLIQAKIREMAIDALKTEGKL
jgi:hypothetical protein